MNRMSPQLRTAEKKGTPQMRRPLALEKRTESYQA